MRVAALCAALLLASCSQFIQYTDEIREGAGGRTSLVTVPTLLGGSAGFIVGIPADIVALPVTYPIWSYQRRQNARADRTSTLLFPSFAFWRIGMLLGAPFDALEFAAYRAWRAERTMTRQEREAIESEHDREAYPTYPVKPLYPDDAARAAAEAARR